MTDEMQQKLNIEPYHGSRCEHNQQSINRINRLMGQLNALKGLIEADDGTCEERVIRARTVEKGINSLTRHMVECYLVNTVRYEMADDPDGAIQDITRLFELLNK